MATSLYYFSKMPRALKDDACQTVFWLSYSGCCSYRLCAGRTNGSVVWYHPMKSSSLQPWQFLLSTFVDSRYMSSGGAPTALAHQCSWWFPHILKCEVKNMGMGHLWLKWVGHLQLRWMGQLWQSELLFFGRYAQNENTGLQGSTLSGHSMTTGFGLFEFPTHGLLQKEQDHSPPKVCSGESSFWLAHNYGHSQCYEYSNY